MSDYNKALNILLDLINSFEQNDSKNTANDSDNTIPLGISNRHIHLSKDDLNKLFGENYELTHLKDLSQPKQFACSETVTICGPKGSIEKVRILGPVRKETQVELLAGDCFKLGIKGDVRLSGDLDGTPSLTIIGKKGSVELKKGAIVAQRHIHMTPKDAEKFNVSDKELVCIKIDGDRGGIFSNTLIRVTDESALECHIDTEEANAIGATSNTKITVIKNN